MTYKLYFLLYIMYSVVGWIIEVIATSKDTKCFVNRGFLLGPYCPIYGFCALSMVYLIPDIDDLLLLFISSVIICSFTEYITSYLMEKLFKARWWDYSKNKFNLNGRICLKNSIYFGILGVFLVKYVNPLFSELLISIPNDITNILFIVIFIVFLIDNIISFKVVLKIKETTRFIKMDNTKEITEKVKQILSKSFLTKRLINAFPNFKIIIKDIERKIRGKNEKEVYRKDRSRV